jgi:hypothetical protein
MNATPFKTLKRVGSNPEILRGRGSIAYSFAAYFFAGGMIYGSLDYVDFQISRAITPILVGIIFSHGIYRVVHRPYLLFTDTALGIRNPFSTTVIDWGDVKAIKTKFTFTVLTKDREIRCWSAVGPGRRHHRRMHPSDLRGFHQGSGDVKISDTPGTDSGTAGYIAQLRLNQRIDIKSAPVNFSATTDWLGISITAISVIAAFISALHS